MIRLFQWSWRKPDASPREPDAPSQPRIFISYARADGRAFADALRAKLKARGLEPWQDLFAMQSGDWRAQIWNAIERAEHLVLVLTRGSIGSEVVEDEWHHARKSGKEVSPVLADSSLDYVHLPAWMRADHIYKFDVLSPTLDRVNDFTRLLDVLKGPSLQRRMPTIARTAGARFVKRPKEMAALRDMLLDSQNHAVGVTTAFAGSGGMGKTTLALALAHDPKVQLAFHHGQILVELGQTPNLLQALAGATTALTGKPSMVSDVNAAAHELAEAIGKRRILMVIDDVWDRAHLAPFLQGGDNCARLITTRDESVLPRGTQAKGVLHVDEMSPEQAVDLIGRDLPMDQLPAAKADLLVFSNELGRCALLLDLANGVLFALHQDGFPVVDALADARLRFAKAGVVAFDISNAGAREDAYSRTIEASLSLLTADDKARFLELAIFPEDTDVPWSVIGAMWAMTGGFSSEQSNELLSRLTRKSLLKRPEQKDAGAAARLHDVVRQYLLDQFRVDPDQLATLNGTLVDALTAAADVRARDNAVGRYYLARLPWHMHAAGRRQMLDTLLLNPAWMQAKLTGLESPLPLVDDYEQFGRGQMQNLVGRTLRLIAGICARDQRQLLPQLLGRLMACPDPAAPAFLASARRLVSPPAILEQRPSLTPPGAETARLEGHTSVVRALVLLPDGRLASGSADNTIRLWDVANGIESVRLRGDANSICALAVLPDGRLAAGSNDGTVQIWDVASGAPTIRLRGHAGMVWALAVLPDGRLASCSGDRSIRLWDTTSGVEEARLQGHEGSVQALIVLSDGRLASGSEDKTIRVWDTVSGTESARVALHTGWVSALAVLPDGQLAIGSQFGEVQLWDPTSRIVTAQLAGDWSPLWAIVVLRDGRLALGSNSGSIRLWNPKGDTGAAPLGVHARPVWSLAVLPDGRLASCSADMTIKLWNPAIEREPCQKAEHETAGHPRAIRALHMLPDGRLASCSDDTTIKLWDTAAGSEIAVLKSTNADRVWSLAVLQDGRLASGSEDNTIRLWDPVSVAETARLEGHTGWVNALAVLPNGWLASGSKDHTIRLWDTARGVETACLKGHSARIRALVVIPDGRLVSGSEDNTIRVWDLARGNEVRCLGRHSGPINALAILPTGQIVSGSGDGTIRQWSLSGGGQGQQLAADEGWIWALVALSDGRLASGANDGTIQLWNPGIGAKVVRLQVDGAVLCPAALPDGRLVAGDQLGRLHWLQIVG